MAWAGTAAADGPCVYREEADVADTLIELADARDAAVIVIGSHGVTGLRSRIMGSVARKLLSHSRRPAVVVRRP